jgi:transcriptional regulator GlxA family with amidase domain
LTRRREIAAGRAAARLPERKHSDRLATRHRFGFLTVPRYSMIALTSAVEPLRMANRLCNEDVYAWSIVSLDGVPVAASNGLALSPTVSLDAMGPVDVVFVCGGVDVQRAVSRELLAALRRLARERVALGSLCTGGYALAKAGLLDKYRAAIHWENMSALREEFPRIDFTEQIFAIDRDRYTCSGGIAPLDLMLNLIQDDLGRDIAPLISEQFILDRIRNDRDLDRAPTKYYLELRLGRARELLLQTSMSIMDITTACGFRSPPHFSKCYRLAFGYPPSAERSAARARKP